MKVEYADVNVVDASVEVDVVPYRLFTDKNVETVSKLVVESGTEGVVKVESAVVDNVDASVDSLVVDVPYELVDWDK